MRQARFAVYVALGAFLVTFVMIVWLMVQEAPGRPNVPFMGTMIDASERDPIVYLPNRLFSCTDQNQQFRCEASLQNRSLQVILEHGKDYTYNLQNCRAIYDSKPVNCKPGLGGYMTNRGLLSYYVFDDTLGLTSTELRELQHTYWLTNRMGLLAEKYVWFAGLGVAGVGAGLAIALNWVENSKLTRSLTSLSSGFGVAFAVWNSLARISYDHLAQYGIGETTWNRLLPITVITVGIVMSILMGFYLSRQTHWGLKSVIGVIVGAATGTMIWVFAPIWTSMLPPEVLLRSGLALFVGTATALLLWRDRPLSRKLFSCGISALGVWIMLLTLMFYLTLVLGFPD